MQRNPSGTSTVNRSKFGQNFTAVSQRTFLRFSHKKEILLIQEKNSI